MTGEWKIAPLEACKLPQNVATGFSEAMEGMVGAGYVPVLYCASQLVHGTNHMIICKQTLTTREPEEHVVRMILNEPLPTEEGKKWSIVSIDTIA